MQIVCCPAGKAQAAVAFWKLFYHIVWATRDRVPILTPAAEEVVIHAVRHQSGKLACHVHAVNGVTDHIHVAVSIPPKIAVADWVRQIKGRSGYEVNAFYPDLEIPFAWQTSYGALSFGIRQLSTVVAYINHQKTHHADGTVMPYLERDDE